MASYEGLKLAYLSGPAPAVRFYDEIEQGTSNYLGTNYMKRFILLAEEMKATSYVITWHEGNAYKIKKGRFEFENRPLAVARGAKFHVMMLLWQIRAVVAIWKFRPDIVLVTGNQDHWWTLAPLRLLKLRFVASYHSVLWPRRARPTVANKVYNWLNAKLLLPKMAVVVVTSRAIKEQVERQIGQGSRRPHLIEHLPSYERRIFEGIASPLILQRQVFETIFIGRMEVDKGIYDLLSVAESLDKERPGEFEFHFLGDGGELEPFRRAVADATLEHMVHVHGYCDPAAIRSIMSQAHASVVPTRSTLIAGFEMTCAEAILSGRPLITSAVAPALDYLRAASIEVEPDDVAGYRAAIANLKDDRLLYEELCGQCASLQEQFYDERNSWTVAMREAFAIAAK